MAIRLLMASWFAASQLLGGDFVSDETTVTSAEILPKYFWLVNVSGHRPTIILSPDLQGPRSKFSSGGGATEECVKEIFFFSTSSVLLLSGLKIHYH